MRQIIAINGSPKAKDSVSGFLIEQLEDIMNVKFDVYQSTQLIRQENVIKTVTEFLNADVLIIVFPLYVDSLPAPLIQLLSLLETAAKSGANQRPKVYAICNCGFYEADHNRLSLRMLSSFASRCNLRWGYGIGIGCGGFINPKNKNWSKGPAANVYSALCTMGQSIINGTEDTLDVFVTPTIPRFLYKLGAHMGWNQTSKKNGVRKQLRARPHIR
jgi:Flavodoxin-like fold.